MGKTYQVQCGAIVLYSRGNKTSLNWNYGVEPKPWKPVPHQRRTKVCPHTLGHIVTVLHYYTIPRSDLQQSSSLLACKEEKIFLVVNFNCLEPFYLCSYGWTSWPRIFICCTLFLVCLPFGHVNQSCHPPSSPTLPSHMETEGSHQ